MMQLTTSATVLLFSLVSFLFVFPDAYALAQPSVSSVTLHQEGDGRERVRIKLEGEHAPKVYTLDGDNPRLICDFPGAGYAGLVKPVVKGGGTLVTRIRVGAHDPPDRKVRVVLDIEPGRKYTYNREFSKEENILNIVLVPTGPVQKAEKAVAVIEATAAKQVVITGPKKIYRPKGEQKEPPATEPSAAEQKIADPPEGKQPAVAEASPAAPASPAAVDSPVAAATEAETVTEPAADGKTAQPPTPAPVTEEKEDVAAVAEPKAEPATPAPDDAGPEKAAEAAVQPAAEKPAPDAPAAKPEPVATPAPVEAEKAASGGEPEKQADAVEAKPEEKAAEPEVAQEQPQTAPAGQAGGAAEPQLLEISYENSSSKGEMIFFRLNGFYPPAVTADESETPKVNCEFTGMKLGPDVQQAIEARGAYVQKIATTADKKTGKVRVNIDLTAGRDYDLRQVFFKEDNLFVLIVNTLDEENVGPAEEAAADTAPEPAAEAGGK